MTIPIDFSKLSFGALSAERDIQQGLRDYFVESDAYRRIQTGEKSVIIGNRGSGKSAILKMLAERERGNGTIVIELAPEDYSYEMLSSMMIKEKEGAWAKQGAYAAAWKYLIYILIMKKLTAKGTKLKTGPAARVYNYLRDNFQGQQDNPVGILISYLKRFEGFKIGAYEATLKALELQKLYKLEDIVALIPDIIELCKHYRVLVLVDELDRGWDASEDAKAFVSGLFQASITINQLSPDLKVLVSLRRELYDNIPALYEDTQKIRDIIEIVQWEESSLLELAAKRIRYSLADLANEPAQDCWNAVFAETIDYRQAKSFNYIVDRTLYRPREIIQFCIDTAQTARALSSWPINYNIISKAEMVYSQERTKDIAAEYKFQYPGLNTIFEVFRGRPYTFDRNDLELLCLGISVGEYRVGDAESWTKDQSPEFLIDVLWRIGFLRAQAVGGIKALRRSGSSYLGPHQVPNLNLHNVTRFHVHPMFRAFLGMKESRDSHVDEK